MAMDNLNIEKNDELKESSPEKAFPMQNADAFIRDIEGKIRENIAAGKAPFDNINFPDMQLSRQMSHEMGLLLTESEIFREALKKQIAGRQYNPEKVLNFLSGFQFDTSKKKNPLLTAIHKGLETRSDSEQAMKDIPLDTFIRDASFIKDNDNLNEPTAFLRTYDYQGVIEHRIEKGDEISPHTATALADILANNKNFYLNDRNLMSLSPAIFKSDLSSLPDEQKDIIEKGVSSCGQLKQPYRQLSSANNLSEQSFLLREGLSAEEIRGFYLQHNGRRLTDQELYHRIGNNESMAAIRGELAVQLLKNFNEKPELASRPGSSPLGSYILSNGLKEEDIQTGYRNNPAMLREYGIALPDEIAHIVKKDEKLSQNPEFKYIIEAQTYRFASADEMSSSVSPHKELLVSLQKIADQGFAAGTGVEMLLNKAREELLKHEDIPASKQQLAQAIQNKQMREETVSRRDALRNMSQYLQPLEDETSIKAYCDAAGISKEQLAKIAIEKAMGKEVSLPAYVPQRTSGLKGFFASRQKKLAEEKNIRETQESFAKIKTAIDSFAERHKKNPLLAQYPSAEDIKRQLQTDSKYLEQNPQSQGLPDWEQKKWENRIANYEELKEATTKASAKLEYELSLKRSARETSGIKDAEHNTGVFTLEEKAKLRKENPNIQPRALYGKLQDKLHNLRA